MTPELLHRIGRALYGKLYQVPLSNRLGVADRTVRRWLNGQFNIPAGIDAECAELLEERYRLIRDLLGRVKGSSSGQRP